MAQIDADNYGAWWDNLMMSTGRKMKGSFEENNITFTDALIFTSGTRHMMKWIYHHLVAYKRVQPIGSLQLAVKQEMWDFVCDVCAGKTNDRVIMREIVMAFCAIEYFINEKKYDA